MHFNIDIYTNDKTGFIKRKNDLIDEYNNDHSNKLVICENLAELYNELKIVEGKTINNTSDVIKQEDYKNINIKLLKDKLNLCVDEILHTKYEDNWGNEGILDNFTIFSKIDEADVECFLSLLDDFLEENMFFSMIDITELFIRCGIDSAGETVPAESLKQLNEIYLDLKNDDKLYKPFINYLKIQFNKLYKQKTKEQRSWIDEINDEDITF